MSSSSGIHVVATKCDKYNAIYRNVWILFQTGIMLRYYVIFVGAIPSELKTEILFSSQTVGKV